MHPKRVSRVGLKFYSIRALGQNQQPTEKLPARVFTRSPPKDSCTILLIIHSHFRPLLVVN